MARFPPKEPRALTLIVKGVRQLVAHHDANPPKIDSPVKEATKTEGVGLDSVLAASHLSKLQELTDRY